jgi:hypothetical protein
MTARTVWKYAISDHHVGPDRFCIRMPAGAEPLTVQMQDGSPQIWALVEPDQPEAELWFRIAVTGHPIADDIERYVGTLQIDRGSLVFHVFEVTR